MSITTPPQTPAAGGTKAFAGTVKQEHGADGMNMDTTPIQSKFTPLNGIPESNAASEVDEDSEPQTPTKTTPKKRGSNAVKDKTEGTPAKKRTPTKAKAVKEPKTPKAKAVKEKAPKGAAGKSDKRPIPLSFEEADEADRLLVEMKNHGATWKEIKEMWVEKTGQVPGGSTLSGRYSRIKDNLMHLKPGEAEVLRESVREVESRQQSDKWSMVASEMQKRGCDAYGTAFVQKQFKNIQDAIAKGIYVSDTVAAQNGQAEEKEQEELEDGDEEAGSEEEGEDGIKEEDAEEE